MLRRAYASTRYRWVILGAGTLAQATFSALSVGLPALAPALRSHYRLTLGETGVVLGAVGIGMLFTLLPWGLLADRLPERVVIALGLLIPRLAFVVLGGSCIGGAIVALTFIRKSPSTESELEDLRQPMRDPRAWLLGLGAGSFLTAQIAITGFVVLFLHVHRGVSAHAAAL